MSLLVLGLFLFLGAHSSRVFAEAWRTRIISTIGPLAWKGLYSIVSLIGLVLIVKGYALAREAPVILWNPPVAMRHLASLFTLVSFVLLAAAYVPRNRIRQKLGHPMVIGVKLWAFAHLLANQTLADLCLFGGFLLWAVLSFRAARARDRAAAGSGASVAVARGSIVADLLTVGIGLGAWAAFAMVLHARWIGVAPFG
jgi:uncharacterized membrane protein